MPRKQYESYRYDDQDFEYTYPNSSTLRNNHEIHDAALALEKEYQLSAERVLELGEAHFRSFHERCAGYPSLHLSRYVYLGGRIPQGKYLKIGQSVHGNAGLWDRRTIHEQPYQEIP